MTYNIFQNHHSSSDITNNYKDATNKSEIEIFEFRIGELELQKEELLAEINVKYKNN